MLQQLKEKRAADEGFTLIELLIAIVVVGVLAAVVIVGIGSLTDSGEASACSASADAARTASVVHYANNSNTYPTTFAAMTGATPPELVLPAGATATDTVVTGNGWTMTLAAGNPPTFTCS